MAIQSRELVIVRHAKHTPSEADALIDEIGLTYHGVQEARTVGVRLLDEDIVIERSYSFNHIRALGTIAIVLAPSLHTNDVPRQVTSLMRSNKLSIETDLDYLPPGDDEFADKLFESYLRGQNFLFLFRESDKYNVQEHPVSSYSAMASVAARIIRMHTRGRQDSSMLMCAREFLFQSFIAKVAGVVGTDTDERRYVQWYTDTLEGMDESRVNPIRIVREDEYCVSDNYHTYHFNDRVLNHILDQGRGLREP